MIGDLIQSWHEVLVRFWPMPRLANICCTGSLYNLLSLPLSLRKLVSCSPMHLMYVFFFGENATMPNISCGSCVTKFDIDFGRPHMVFL